MQTKLSGGYLESRPIKARRKHPRRLCSRFCILYMDARLSPCAKCLRQMGLALDCANRLKMAAQFATLNSHRSEIMCTARPETIDGLWKLDNEWPKSKCLLAIPEQRELIVTTSTAFYRREVLRYLNEILPAYAPTKRKVINRPA